MNRIKELRLKKGLTQKKVAEVLNTTQQNIALYETGKREPKLTTYAMLAGYFGVSIDYLMGIENIHVEPMITADQVLTEKQKNCKYCHAPFKPIMVNHLVTSHVKDYCKVYLGYLGNPKTDKTLCLICSVSVGNGVTVQVANINNCPRCGRRLNDEYY